MMDLQNLSLSELFHYLESKKELSLTQKKYVADFVVNNYPNDQILAFALKYYKDKEWNQSFKENSLFMNKLLDLRKLEKSAYHSSINILPESNISYEIADELTNIILSSNYPDDEFLKFAKNHFLNKPWNTVFKNNPVFIEKNKALKHLGL